MSRCRQYEHIEISTLSLALEINIIITLVNDVDRLGILVDNFNISQAAEGLTLTSVCCGLKQGFINALQQQTAMSAPHHLFIY